MSLTPRFFDKDFLFEPFPSSFSSITTPRQFNFNIPKIEMCLDMKENDNDFTVHVELPGIDKSKINVTIDNNVLSISAQRSEVKEEDTTKMHISERTYGSLRRSITIPKNVDTDNINAKYLDGVLNIVLPKQTKSNSKSLKIE
jgi:HSP20 family protein